MGIQFPKGKGRNMNKIKKMMAAIAGVVLAGTVAVQAAPDYSELGTAVTEGATAATVVVTVAIIAGFGIFVLIWGARKIKGALSSGG